MTEFFWIDAEGRDITATEAVAGYNVREYFPGVDLDTATVADLEEAYVGPDADGIGVRWAA